MDILVPIEGSRSLDNYSFDYLYLREAVEHLRKHDPRFHGWSLCALAGHAGLAESTFKKLLAGSIMDPRSSTLWLLCTAFDLDPRRLMKLPIPATHKAGADPAGAEDLRRQLGACAEQKQADDLELARLRKRVLEESTARASLETKAMQLEERCIHRGEELKIMHQTNARSRRINVIMTVLFIAALMAYIIFELVYLDLGLTGALRRFIGHIKT